MWIEILFIVLASYILYESLKKPSDYPPGLWGLPLIGYIPVWTNTTDILFDLNKKFGDIVSWRIGNRHFVFVYDFKTIKELFSGPDLVDRPSIDIFTVIAGNRENNKGLVASNGAHWHSIRRFALRHLRDLGMGKSHFSSAVQHEAFQFVSDFKKQAGKPAKIPTSLTISVINVVWQLTASKRYAFDDEKILEFDKLIDDLQMSFGALVLSELFPFLRAILPKFIQRIVFKTNIRSALSEKMTEFMRVHINEHIKTLDQNYSRDFIDDYLIEMEKQKNDPSSTMSVTDLEYCIGDLFGAGTETTTNTLTWAIFYLAKYEDVQRKLQREIDDALPNGSSVTLEDKIKIHW